MLKEGLAESTGVSAGIPSGYQVVGDIILIKLPKIKPAEKKNIGQAILQILPYIRTVCEIKEVSGEFRQPVVKVLSGDKNTTTIHKENQILYKIDVSKVMFSKGNLFERKRLLEHVKEGETIIDMFAGIGYFSLPIARFTKAKEIISIEKNPAAYKLLCENIALNKITNIIAIQKDCRVAASSLGKAADRVIMGYFPRTERFLSSAVQIAKLGCVMHYHNVYHESEIWKKPLDQIEKACKALNKGYKIVTKKKVKSFSPKKWHVVIDFKVL